MDELSAFIQCANKNVDNIDRQKFYKVFEKIEDCLVSLRIFIGGYKGFCLFSDFDDPLYRVFEYELFSTNPLISARNITDIIQSLGPFTESAYFVTSIPYAKFDIYVDERLVCSVQKTAETKGITKKGFFVDEVLLLSENYYLIWLHEEMLNVNTTVPFLKEKELLLRKNSNPNPIQGPLDAFLLEINT